MEANGRLERPNNRGHGRLQRSNNRGLWRQTGSCNARTTHACGQSAWWKLPRVILSILGVLRVLGVSRLANGRLQRSNNRGLSRQAAGFNARTDRGLWRQNGGWNAGTTEGYGGKRQAATLELKCMWQRSNNRGLWRQTARCNARTTDRGLWRQTAGCNDGTTEGYGGKRQAATLELKCVWQRSNNRGKRQADRSCHESLRRLKPRKTSSTPAVVPGAAPALAKAGVGGF